MKTLIKASVLTLSLVFSGCSGMTAKPNTTTKCYTHTYKQSKFDTNQKEVGESVDVKSVNNLSSYERKDCYETPEYQGASNYMWVGYGIAILSIARLAL